MKASVMETPTEGKRSVPNGAEKGTIQIHLAKYGGERNDAFAERYRALLTVEERDQERRFFFLEDQRRYLVTRALVRTVLSRYFPMDPCQWRFRKNPWGKPEIANTEQQEARISFNVSHTQGLIVVAVASGRVLGVDIENIAARKASLEIAEHYFTEEEALRLRGSKGAELQERFFALWTLKESYIKARGFGLSLPLNQCCFRFADASSITLSVSDESGDDAGRWQFWLFRPSTDYLLALCAERRTGSTVEAQWTDPLGLDEVMSLQPLRSSH